MKIGVFVGSFDPVHIGHKNVMDYLIDNNYVDKVIIVPTESYWDKNINTNIVHRINMLKLYENENIIVGSKYSNLKFTYEVLNSIKKDYNVEIFLIMGADNILKFHLWKNIDEILKNKVLVLGRNNINVTSVINELANKDKYIYVDGFIEKQISSTYIREKLKEKKYSELSMFLDSNIIAYIKENMLY